MNTIGEGAVFRGANLEGLKVSVEVMLLKNPMNIKPSLKAQELLKQDLSNTDISSLDIDLEDLGMSKDDFAPGKSSKRAGFETGPT